MQFTYVKKPLFSPNFSQWENLRIIPPLLIVSLQKLKFKDMEPHDYYRHFPELRSRSWQRHSAHTRLMDYIIRKANPAQSQICGIDFPPGTVLISSGQYCEQTGEHPQLFAYALRDLQYEGDIAVTLIGHNLIITLTHYPTPEEAPSSLPASFSEPNPSSSATSAARINIQNSTFHIQKESPHRLPLAQQESTFKIQNSKFKKSARARAPSPIK